MRALGQVVFWTIAAILFLPAAAGTIACSAIIAVLLLVVFLVALALLAVLCVTCLPVIWWCGLWESVNGQAWRFKVKRALSVTGHARNQ